MPTCTKSIIELLDCIYVIWNRNKFSQPIRYTWFDLSLLLYHAILGSIKLITKYPVLLSLENLRVLVIIFCFSVDSNIYFIQSLWAITPLRCHRTSFTSFLSVLQCSNFYQILNVYISFMDAWFMEYSISLRDLLWSTLSGTIDSMTSLLEWEYKLHISNYDRFHSIFTPSFELIYFCSHWYHYLCIQEPFVNIPDDIIREALKVVLGTMNIIL